MFSPHRFGNILVRGTRLLASQPPSVSRSLCRAENSRFFTTSVMDQNTATAMSNSAPSTSPPPSAQPSGATVDRSHFTSRGRGGGGRGGGRGRGGRGRGRGRGGYNQAFGRSEQNFTPLPEGLRSHEMLTGTLASINGASYGSYRRLEGTYQCAPPKHTLKYKLCVDRVQADPYASPSRFRVQIPTELAGIPKEIYGTSIKKAAFCDYITRHFHGLLKGKNLDVVDGGSNWNGPKGGAFAVNFPSQQVLERTSCLIQEVEGKDIIEIRFTISLPAFGRTINGQKASEMLLTHLPELTEKSILWDNHDPAKIADHIRSVEVQQSLRDSLAANNLVAFVGNGSILPRQSGASPLPMSASEGAVAFQCPLGDLEVEIDTGIQDSAGNPIKVKGMGIPRGVTVITGGGFHGKTTLLEAIEFGIYNTVPGDGRELVVSDPNAFKIRAEDGRNVVDTDITPFINDLPGGKSTNKFTTMDASGSTSMAANIQEALEIGATTLVIDEDTSATNFLVRDKRMQLLIKNEPITPLVSKARALYDDYKVSTLIVIGGCGDYLSIADTVIGMESYQPSDITVQAKDIAQQYPDAITLATNYGSIPKRIPCLPDLSSGKPPVARATRAIELKHRERIPGVDQEPEVIDISFIAQFVEVGQANLCAAVLRYISTNPDKKHSMREWSEFLEERMDKDGLDVFDSHWLSGDRVKTRGLELLAVVNRLRGLAVEEKS